jgi:RHS repeat-associated protein
MKRRQTMKWTVAFVISISFLFQGMTAFSEQFWLEPTTRSESIRLGSVTVAGSILLFEEPWELLYDDGIPESAMAFNDPGNYWGTDFKSPVYPCEIDSVKWMIWPDWPDPDREEIEVSIWDAGTDGIPGGEDDLLLWSWIGPSWTETPEWNVLYVEEVSVDRPFFIAIQQLTTFPDCDAVAMDTTAPDWHDWVKELPDDWTGPYGWGDWMMRVWVDLPVSPAPPESLEAERVGPMGIDVSWVDPPDNDLDHIDLYRNGVRITSVGAGVEYYQDYGVALGSYTYYAVAVDTSGEESDPSEPSDIELEDLEPSPEQVPAEMTGSITTVADPLFYHSGEFYHKRTPLEIPGRGLFFELMVEYRSQVVYNGPLGWGWDHTYNMRLAKAPNANIYFYNGLGRREEYILNPDGTYTSPAGHYDQLVAHPDGSYTLRESQGIRIDFDPRGRMVSMAGRSGNTLHFHYNAHAQMDTVTETLGRKVAYDYDPQGQLTQVTDFAGRTVTFGYNEHNQLVSITSPHTPDYPYGKTTTFTYTTGFPHPSLNNNMLTITDPAGQVYLTNVYDSYDRVYQQTYGTGTHTISYDPFNYQTTVTDRVGNIVRWTYCTCGTPISKVEYTNRNVRPTDPDSFVTTYEHNSNTEITKVIYPRGNFAEFVYDTTNLDPLKRGNLLAVWLHSSPSNPPDSIGVTFTYEPLFNQAKTKTGLRGYITTYVFDYEVDPADSQGNIVRIEYPSVTLPDSSIQTIQEEFSYNQYGQITTAIDPEGNLTEYEYYPPGDSCYGFLQRVIQDPGGVNITTEYGWDRVGNPTSFTDGNGNTTAYEINQLNQVTKMTYPPPQSYEILYHYDLNDNLVQIDYQKKDKDNQIDPTNPWLTWTFTYDILDNLLSMTQEIDAESTRTISYQYDANENQIRVIQPEGNIIETVYDERDLIYTRTRGYGTPEASTETFNYDGNVNITELYDGEGYLTQYTYDDFDREIQETDALGNYTLSEWDPAHHVRSRAWYDSSNTLLRKNMYEYDEMGRPYEMAELNWIEGQPGIDSVQTVFWFDRNGSLVRFVDDNGHHVEMSYDGADRLSEWRDHLGNRIEFTLDGNDNLIQTREVEDAEIFTTQITYDPLNRQTSLIDNHGNTAYFKYDSRDNLDYIEDMEGTITEFLHDGLCRPIRIMRYLQTDGSAIDTIFIQQVFDRNGRLVEIIDEAGNSTVYTYDALNRRVSERYADNTMITWEYNRNSGVTKVTDQNGTVIEDSLDALGWLVRREITRAPGVGGTTFEEYAYDGFGRRTYARDDDSEVTFTYDSMDRIIKSIQNGEIIESEYDGVGNRSKLIYPCGEHITYQHDELDRIDYIQDRFGSTIANYTYSGPTRVKERMYLNGTKLHSIYDGMRRIVDLSHYRGGNTKVLGFQYGYDKVGNRLYERRTRGVDHRPKVYPQSLPIDVYSYDNLYRLVTVEYGVSSPQNPQDPSLVIPETAVLYNYDTIGNRASVVSDGDTTWYVSNNMNEYEYVGGVPYVYDDNGNVVDDGMYTYLYDYANRLIQVTRISDGRVLATYTYDPLSRRTSKEVWSDSLGVYTTTSFYYDGLQCIEEQDEYGTPIATYVYGPGIDEILCMNRGGQTYYYHSNPLGNVGLITDSNGDRVEWYSYDVYGNVTIHNISGGVLPVSGIGNRFMYTGREWDAETGLYYYRARYYDPVTGRFIQRDPQGYRDGMNLYTYVGNNPVNYTDPEGTKIISVMDSSMRPGSKGYESIKASEKNLQDMVNTVKVGMGKKLKEKWESKTPHKRSQEIASFPKATKSDIDSLTNGYGVVSIPLQTPKDTSESAAKKLDKIIAGATKDDDIVFWTHSLIAGPKAKAEGINVGGKVMDIDDFICKVLKPTKARMVVISGCNLSQHAKEMANKLQTIAVVTNIREIFWVTGKIQTGVNEYFRFTKTVPKPVEAGPSQPLYITVARPDPKEEKACEGKEKNDKKEKK